MSEASRAATGSVSSLLTPIIHSTSPYVGRGVEAAAGRRGAIDGDRGAWASSVDVSGVAEAFLGATDNAEGEFPGRREDQVMRAMPR